MSNTDGPTAPRRATLRIGARERVRLQAVVIAVIIVLLAIALRPLLLHLIQVRDFQTCQTNLRKIAQALSMYTQEWDDSYPSASIWLDAARGNLSPTTGSGYSADYYLKCPRDRTEGQCSYLYNSLMQGLSLTVRDDDPEKSARRRQLRRLDRAPLVIEKHGSELNAHSPLADWDAVAAAMGRPHQMPEPSGGIVLGNGRAWFKTEEQLAGLRSRQF